MWEKLRRFSALDQKARVLFVRALIALPFIAQSLHWRGFRATKDALGRSKARVKAAESSDHSRVALTVRMVKAAARHGVGHPSCLEESLALWWLLGRQGISCEVRIGVRKESGCFEAHAWVEHAGAALNEPEGKHRHYAAFDAGFPSVAAEQR